MIQINKCQFRRTIESSAVRSKYGPYALVRSDGQLRAAKGYFRKINDTVDKTIKYMPGRSRIRGSMLASGNAVSGHAWARPPLRVVKGRYDRRENKRYK